MKTLKLKIEKILKKYPYTRNDDTALSIQLWQDNYPNIVKGGIIKLSNLQYLPCIKDVARIRAIFQNDLGKYLPTCWEVAKNRNMKRERWVELLKAS